jgi:CHAT domain-containing protein
MASGYYRESALWARVRKLTYCGLALSLFGFAPGADAARSSAACAPSVSQDTAKEPAPGRTGDKSAESQTPPEGQPVRLEAGKPIERAITGTETHSYILALSAGFYLYLSVEQLEVDVKAAIFGPDGAKLKEVDRRHLMDGAERIWLITPASGDYRLDVNRSDRSAGPGRYKVTLEELRPAANEDPARALGRDIMESGQQLFDQKTTKGVSESLAEFAEAGRVYHSLGDPRAEGDTIYWQGLVFHTLGEYQKAIDFFDRALAVYHLGPPDPYFEAKVLTNKGESNFYLSQYQKAMECYEQSLQVCSPSEINRDCMASWTLNNMGSVYDAAGDAEKALDYYNRSLSFSQSLPEGGSARDSAIALTNIGGVYASLGDASTALGYLARALPNWREADDKWGEARVLHRMGVVYVSEGQFEDALRSYEQALVIWRETGDRFNEAKTIDAIGVAHQRLGDNAKASASFTEALAVRRAIGDRQGAASSLYHLAQVERDRGNLIESRAEIERALDQAESVRGSTSNDGLRSSYLAETRGYYELYIDVLMELHRRNLSNGQAHENLDAEALGVSERSRARSLIDLLTEARVDIREGVDPKLVARERDIGQRLNAKANYQYRLIAHGQAADAAAAGNDILALSADLDQVRARIRTASPHYAALTQPRALSLKQIQQEILDPDTLLLEYALGDERSYLWAVTKTSLDAFELPGRATLEGATRRFYELLTARNQHLPETPEQRLQRISQADAEYPEAARSLGQMLLGPVASLLGDKRLLIVGDGALQYVPFQALQSPSGSATSATAISTDSYRPLMADHEIVTLPSASTLAVLRQEKRSRPVRRKLVAVLADPVFTPDDPRVRSAERGRRFIKTHSNNEPPAALAQDSSLGASALAAGEMERSLRDAGISADVLGVPRLPLAREEAEGILSLAPAHERLGALDFDASRATAKDSKLAQYKIVHFATHGVLDSAHPELSGIMLSMVNRHGQPQDGFLRLHEIYNLKLPADLVVLSACQTGLGKEIRGEGLVGLTRGFMYAGAKRVVASLWKIDDRATAELMKRFYNAMLGNAALPPSKALRHAEIEMWKTANWNHPYYWAAFVLQGEWK